jgi:hypothetical protein
MTDLVNVRNVPEAEIVTILKRVLKNLNTDQEVKKENIEVDLKNRKEKTLSQ